MKRYVFLQLKEGIKYPNGLYNGLYNSEPALITIKEGVPTIVQFTNNSQIYAARGILVSSTEILIDSKEILFSRWVTANDWVWIPSKQYWVNEEQEENITPKTDAELFEIFNKAINE